MYRNDLSFIFLLNLVYSDDDYDSDNHEDNGYGIINHDSSDIREIIMIVIIIIVIVTTFLVKKMTW
jgi:hypothetical protein